MFPEKESVIALEQYAKLQKRIYPDACDFGIKLNEISDDQRKDIRGSLRNLMEFYGWTGAKWGDNRCKGQRWTICIPIEMSDYGKPGAMDCVTISVTWSKEPRCEHVMIEFGRVTGITEEERKNNFCNKLRN